MSVFKPSYENYTTVDTIKSNIINKIAEGVESLLTTPYNKIKWGEYTPILANNIYAVPFIVNPITDKNMPCVVCKGTYCYNADPETLESVKQAFSALNPVIEKSMLIIPYPTQKALDIYQGGVISTKTEFCCSNSKLTELPNLPATLQELYCFDNKLTELPNLPATLQTLDCNWNKLTELPDLPATLQTLYCQSNQLTELPNLPATLRILYCSDNKLIKLPNLPATLQDLYCDNNKLIELPDLPATLKKLCCYNNPQLNITYPLLNQMKTMKEKIAYINEINHKRREPPQTELDLSCKSLNELPLPLSPQLEQLYCERNNLAVLPELPATLQRLVCTGNQLTQLPKLPNQLTELCCSENKLTQIPELPQTLIEINCRDNKLHTLPELPQSLRTLFCNDNQLAQLPDLPEELTKFVCCGNPQLKVLYPRLDSLNTVKEKVAYINETNRIIKIVMGQ